MQYRRHGIGVVANIEGIKHLLRVRNGLRESPYHETRATEDSRQAGKHQQGNQSPANNLHTPTQSRHRRRREVHTTLRRSSFTCS